MSVVYIVSAVMCVHVGQSARLECEKSHEFKQGSDLFFRVSIQRCVQTTQPALPTLSLSRPGSGGRAFTGVCAIYADSHLRLLVSIRERQFPRVCILSPPFQPCETYLEQDHKYFFAQGRLSPRSQLLCKMQVCVELSDVLSQHLIKSSTCTGCCVT